MTHLSSDELIDAMEDLLSPERRAHLASCAECQHQLDELASVLNEARQTSVPEPSPLFWNQLSRRVRASIDAEPVSAWAPWLRWQMLLPLGAMAVVVLALVLSVTRPAHVALDSIDSPALENEVATDNWGTLTAIVGELDIETASAAGVIEPGTADLAVLHLTAEEQQELTRLLQAELTRAKS